MLLSVILTGFVSQTVSINPNANAHQTLDFVLTPESRELQNVTVNSRPPLLQQQNGRLVFNVAGSATLAGSNALEAIGKTPGVLLNRQFSSITLAGKGAATVLVNDKPLQLTGADLFAYLEAMPAEQLARVEVIANPASEYDAAGTAGLINIVLKKNRKQGLSAQANSSYQQAHYATLTAGGNINYHHEQLTAFAGMNLSSGAKYQVERLNTPFGNEEYRLTDPYKKSVTNGQLTAGVTYQLSPSSEFSLNYSGNSFNRRDEVNNYTAVIENSTGNTTATLSTKGHSKQWQHTHLLNLSYELRLDTTGRKLSFAANRLWYGSDRQRPTTSENYFGFFQSPTGFLTNNLSEGNNHIAISSAQADAVLPYPWAQLSAGGKFSHIAQESESNYYELQGSAYAPVPGAGNRFAYTERIGALYVKAQKKIGKIGLQAGIRAELTSAIATSQNLSQPHKESYCNWFPSLQISYQPTENQAWSLSYSKRILRPGFSDLDPFRLYLSPVSYAEGNPFLTPSFSHEAALSLTLKSRYTFQGYYQEEQNHFGLVFGADSASKTTYIRHENYSDNQTLGLGVVAALQPFPFWELQAQLFGNYTQVNPYPLAGNTTALRLPSYFASVTNALSLNKKGTLLTEVTAYLVGKYQWELSEVAPTGSLDTGFKALLLDRRMIVQLSATDLLRTATGRSKNVVTGQTMNSYFDQQSLRLAVTFKMGSNKSYQPKETGIEPEQGRM